MNEEDAKTYLNLGITADEVVKLRWPDINDHQAGHLLWEHTPYPMRSGLLDVVEMVADLPESCDCPRLIAPQPVCETIEKSRTGI
jgi:hypothetical protein